MLPKKEREERLMEMDVFEPLWNIVGDTAGMTSNCYRIFVDICLHGATTQKDFWERRNWKISSVSNTIRKLYDMKMLDCRLENRKIVYFPNLTLITDSNEKRDSHMSMETFSKLWEQVCEMERMTSNCYRVYIDICLYGETSQKDLWERRNWKKSGVCTTFHKLYDMGLLICKENNGQKLYTAKIDFISEK